MKTVTKIATFLTVALLASGSLQALQAQDHVTSDAELRSAVTEKMDREAADRAVVQRLLEREEVRQVAGEHGFDVERAADAASGLEGRELDRVASMARTAEKALAGGATTITITSTALIIALLVLILIIVA